MSNTQSQMNLTDNKKNASENKNLPEGQRFSDTLIERLNDDEKRLQEKDNEQVKVEKKQQETVTVNPVQAAPVAIANPLVRIDGFKPDVNKATNDLI